MLHWSPRYLASSAKIGPPLTAQVDGERLEVLGEERHRPLVAPPRLRLTGDEQQGGEVVAAGDGMVEQHLTRVEQPLLEGLRHVGARRIVRAERAAIGPHGRQRMSSRKPWRQLLPVGE